MITNFPALSEVYADLQSLLEKLLALDAAVIDSANLVPMMKAVQSIGAYQCAIDAQIQARAIGNNELIPGVVVKDAVTQRRWNDSALAGDLAFAQFGLKAFTLNSPAALEKMGDEGSALVAVASYKPPAGKRVVY